MTCHIKFTITYIPFIHRNLPFSFTGILASTLFTFHDHACDNERLRISCPEGTTISVQSAKYGRSQPQSAMCPFAGGGYYWGGGGGKAGIAEDLNCAAPSTLEVGNLSIKITY